MTVFIDFLKIISYLHSLEYQKKNEKGELGKLTSPHSFPEFWTSNISKDILCQTRDHLNRFPAFCPGADTQVREEDRRKYTVILP